MDLDACVERRKVTPAEKASILKAGEVKVRPCADPKKEGVNQYSFIPMEELTRKFDGKLLATSPGDTLFNVGWVLQDGDETFKHSNWKGFMKSIHSNDTRSKDFIEFEPVIDASPEDHDTICTVLLECIEKAGPNKIAVVTMDFPLWFKAVDIAKSKKLKVILRLGGAYLLK